MTDQITISYRAAQPSDIAAIVNLLEQSNLPSDCVEEYLDGFFVAESNGNLIGCAGFEEHGAAALLRSVTIIPEFRGHKIAEKLYGEIVKLGRDKGLREIALLTTTAEGYFARFGFKVVNRNEIDPDLLESDQFRTLCPSTAVCMRIALGCKPIGAQLGFGVKR